MEPMCYPVAKDFYLIGKKEKAFAVLNLAQTEYPNSANAYYFQGEAYKLMGKKERAIQNYKKALDLDPDSDKVTNALDEIQITICE